MNNFVIRNKTKYFRSYIKSSAYNHSEYNTWVASRAAQILHISFRKKKERSIYVTLLST